MNRKRKFSSYGPINLEYEYGVPRHALVEQAVNQLVGEAPARGGHYFTVWAPRQTGKTWVLRSALWQLWKDDRFCAVKCNLQVGNIGEDPVKTGNYILQLINEDLKFDIPFISDIDEFQKRFTRQYLKKPLILILDEFDSLEPHTIQKLVGEFRNMYIRRNENLNLPLSERPSLLHGVALIGVRSVLGVENPRGSPFNVQRSIRIPNLTFDEVKSMFDDYQNEYGQKIDADVVEKLYYETAGQPGIVSWFGELLTESYNPGLDKTITMKDWKRTWLYATRALPDNNAMNIIAKANDPAYKPTVLDLFQTEKKLEFVFRNPIFNYLYMNGIITYEELDNDKGEATLYARFSSPYIQKSLFDRFGDDLFQGINAVLDPFDQYKDVFVKDELVLRPVFRRYEKWLAKNAWYLFKDVPRRADMRIYEAVYHFNIFHYLASSLRSRGVSVIPEFPTGNGKIDLLLHYKNSQYGLELKSFSDEGAYHKAIKQAAWYGKSLGLKHIDLLFFIDAIDDKNRAKYETDDVDAESGVRVIVSFAETCNGEFS